MNVYKITNITHLLGKRDNDYNSTLRIKYVDGMITKTLILAPQEIMFLSITTLPLSVHRLRIKKLVSVTEIANKELVREMVLAKPTPVPPEKPKKEKILKAKQTINVEEEKEKTEKVTTPKGKKTSTIKEKTETETAE